MAKRIKWTSVERGTAVKKPALHECPDCSGYSAGGVQCNKCYHAALDAEKRAEDARRAARYGR